MSPPTTSTRVRYATLFQGGRETIRYTCFRLHCEGADADQNLAGLVAAARPVTNEFETVTGRDAIEARARALMTDDSTFLMNGAEELSPLAETYPGFVYLDLPSVVAAIEDEARFDPKPLEARLETEITATLREAGIDAQIDRLSSGLGWSRYTLWRGDKPALDPEGHLVYGGYLPAATPSIRIWLNPEDVPDLEPLMMRFNALGQTNLPGDDELASRIPALLAAREMDDDPSAFRLRTQIHRFNREARIGAFREPSITLTYYRLITQ